MSRALAVAFEAYVADFSGKLRTGRSYFREVSTRKHPWPTLHSILLRRPEVDYTCRRFTPLARTSCTNLLDLTAVPGGSGSPPESWRRRGLEHGIHFRRQPR